MVTTVGIFIMTSMMNFMFSFYEQEKFELLIFLCFIGEQIPCFDELSMALTWAQCITINNIVPLYL